MGKSVQIDGKDGPIAALMLLSDGMPHVANYAMKKIAYKAVQNAKDYLRHKKEPPAGKNVPWRELWNESQELYKWTPEFNLKQREAEVNRSNDDQLFDTGKLANSIRLISQTRSKSGKKAYAKIGSSVSYAELMEVGGINALGKYVPPRPYLIPAIISVKNDRRFLAILKNEIIAAMKEVKKNRPVRFKELNKPD